MTFTLPVRVSVCPFAKYLKKILKQSTSFLTEAFSLTQRGKHSIPSRGKCSVCVCGGGGARRVAKKNQLQVGNQKIIKLKQNQIINK